MSCSRCGGTISACNDCDFTPVDTDTILKRIANGDANFKFGKVTPTICSNLGDNKGVNPNINNSHEDIDDLKDLSKFLNGETWNMVPSIDLCDKCSLQNFLKKMIKNSNSIEEAIICALGGIWDILGKIVDANGRFGVMNSKYQTVPASEFSWTEPRETNGHIVGGSWAAVGLESQKIRIPISDMDGVYGAIVEPQVNGGQVFAVSVAIQNPVIVGDYYEIDYDVYITAGASATSTSIPPFDVTVQAFVFGYKNLDFGL